MQKRITSFTMLTLGGDPLDSSIATPTRDMRAPNQVREGTLAPNMPSIRGTTITCPSYKILTKLLFTVVSSPKNYCIIQGKKILVSSLKII